jgi:chemotaxis protein methyltransferase CheR
VRSQVCKRIDRRIAALELGGLPSYKAYLSEHASEWAALDALCSIPISRFYRDRAVFDALGEQVLPEIAQRASGRNPAVIRCWSAGCASGEEPYTLSLLWDLRVSARYPHTRLAITATDVDGHLLDRARAACYARSSVRELPPHWIDIAFTRHRDIYCLRDRWTACVEFRHQDIRLGQPPGPFDLVLCRNVAFTYFSEPVQRNVLAGLAACLRADGVLVVGRHESLPADGGCFRPWPAAPGIYRRA